MSELNIVPNGALLIRNGTIEDVGPSRRVENLAGARNAREIDATGRMVMAAFVDADVSIVVPVPLGATAGGEARDESTALGLMSRKRVLMGAAAMAAECARYGSLAVGAHTRCATDIQNTGKVLRVHKGLQLKPLRIRSIFSPHFPAASAQDSEQLMESLISKWLPAVRSKKLAAVLELTLGGSTFDTPILTRQCFGQPRSQQALGYAIRLRSTCRLEAVDLQLALSAGAIAIVAPMDTLATFAGPLSAVGCVRVIPASEGFDDACNAAPAIRRAIREGAAIAIASSYRSCGISSLNMQYLLHLAVHGGTGTHARRGNRRDHLESRLFAAAVACYGVSRTGEVGRFAAYGCVRLPGSAAARRPQ